MAVNTLSILKPSVNNLTTRIFVRAAGLDFEELEYGGRSRRRSSSARIRLTSPRSSRRQGCRRARSGRACAIMQYLCNHVASTASTRPTGQAGDGRQRDVLSHRHAFPLVARATYPVLGFPSYPGEVATADVSDELKEHARKSAEAAIAAPLDVYRAWFLDGKTFIGGDTPPSPDIVWRRRSSSCARSTTTSRCGQTSTSPRWRSRSAMRTRSRLQTSAATSST